MKFFYVVNKLFIDYNKRTYMPRVHAETCDCDCKMKRLYVRTDGGKGWTSVGWMCMCGCGCISLD